MLDLPWYEFLLVGVIFIWSGFVRTGLGFGGALLSLPFLLLVDNRPLVYLPIIAMQLLFFAMLTIVQNNLKPIHRQATGVLTTIDWVWLKKSMAVMILPKMIGVFGLLSLRADVMSSIIFTVILAYSLTYICNRPLQSNHKVLDWLFLALGGYISGTSLIGAPLIVAVAAHQVEKSRLRDTLFAVWIILVLIKMGVFIYSGVDMQWANQLWLLPCAALGHVLGLRFHDYLLSTNTVRFYRFLGVALFFISLIGLWQAW